VLELDHVFCLVPGDGDWAARLAAGGWSLDAGTVHDGQGSRNRRLVFAHQYLELVWLHDVGMAMDNPLRLDRRADWANAGASPFGFGLRGLLPPAQQEEFWPYDALGLRIWVHRDNERAPERPMVFVLEIDPAERLRRRPPEATVGDRSQLLAVRHTGPAPAALPTNDGPPVEYMAGDHRLELIVDGGRAVGVTEQLTIASRGRDA
jgi:hypothetical protein